MASVRVDPLTGSPTVISEHRIPAPPAFTPGTLPQVAVCPFCPGHEHLTGDTIAAREDERGWEARAFPNRRPALRPEEPSHSIGDELVTGHTAVGAHEVIAEGRGHGVEPDPSAQRAALQLAADRLLDLRRDERFAMLGWYRNRGVEAGASQPHPHAQVVATAVVSGRAAEMVERQRRTPGLIQRLADAAARDGRVVLERGGVVAFTPWAPSAPFEVWFAPTERVPRLWQDRGRVDGLADALGAITSALHEAFALCPYNAILFDAPQRVDDRETSWHVRVVPRLVPSGGFELWTGGGMHPSEPVGCAAVLRGLVR